MYLFYISICITGDGRAEKACCTSTIHNTRDVSFSCVSGKTRRGVFYGFWFYGRHALILYGPGFLSVYQVLKKLLKAREEPTKSEMSSFISHIFSSSIWAVPV